MGNSAEITHPDVQSAQETNGKLSENTGISLCFFLVLPVKRGGWERPTM